MSKHTPGPWHALLRAGPLSVLITSIGGKRIGAVTSNNEADAKLIAAAPDLLEALQDVSNKARPRALVSGGKCAEYIIDREVMERLRAALAALAKAGA